MKQEFSIWELYEWQISQEFQEFIASQLHVTRNLVCMFTKNTYGNKVNLLLRDDKHTFYTVAH